ncbi:unnamed protein product [Cylicocyclus nassatus]|uniref:7TM GPCR serpentine receptor class x (Srx) domain-containing protein n=1 Tax=Cylicocyclus nassatus TaxID=53992 RepID=A0AA36HAG0_CYLNA|nr:unnamed protein product [Cylicocyclus nassatus]
MIAIIWASSIILTLIINIYVKCRFVYWSLLNAFVFVTDEASEFNARSFYFTKNLGTFVLTISVDFITILAVRNTSNKLANKSREFHVRRSRELNLLKQAVAQAAAFAAQIFSISWLAWQFDNGWAIWSFTVVAWNLLHLIDPVIIIACNKEFRRLIFSLTKISTQPLKSTTSLHAVFHSRQNTS